MEIKRVGVAGCGQMGAGIAQVCAEAGHPVLVREVSDELLDKGLERIEAFLDIVESYRRHVEPAPEKPFQRRYRVVMKDEYCDVLDTKTGRRWDIRDPGRRFADRFVLGAGHTIPLIYCTLAVLNEALRLAMPEVVGA